MRYRILKRQLLFFHHLATLSPDSLAREIFEVQKEMKIPGLVSECNKILVEAGLIDVDKYSKPRWKSVVNRLCRKLNEDDLLNQIRNYKKLEYSDLKKEHCELKSYMVNLNLHDARMRFKIRAQMTPTIQMNFKNDPAFKANLWTCSGCYPRTKHTVTEQTRTDDTQSHVLICDSYADLRKDKDLSDDKDLVDFFVAVISRRMKDSV